MEFVGAFQEGDWESLSKMFSAEDLEFTPHFLGQFSYNSHNSQSTNDFEGTTMLPNSESNNDHRDRDHDHDHESLFHTLESLNNLQYQLSQESSHSSDNSGTHDTHNYITTHSNYGHINTSDELFVPNFLVDQNEHVKENNLKRDINEYDSVAEATESSDQNPKKKPRVQRSKKSNAKSGKKGKVEEIENSNTSSYSSEDENNDSTIVNLTGKPRASRGSATDPQSLYARKRRERINERLRILQNIVPNGTKVDISTMLEEAVHYVKFLQLQIKLLSSDDMWMYAPIAYNGMDIGLTNKLSQLV